MRFVESRVAVDPVYIVTIYGKDIVGNDIEFVTKHVEEEFMKSTLPYINSLYHNCVINNASVIEALLTTKSTGKNALYSSGFDINTIETIVDIEVYKYTSDKVYKIYIQGDDIDGDVHDSIIYRHINGNVIGYSDENGNVICRTFPRDNQKHIIENINTAIGTLCGADNSIYRHITYIAINGRTTEEVLQSIKNDSDSVIIGSIADDIVEPELNNILMPIISADKAEYLFKISMNTHTPLNFVETFNGVKVLTRKKVN